MVTAPRILHIAHGISSYNNSLVEMAHRLGRGNIELHVACHVDLSKILQASPAIFIKLDADKVVGEARHEAIRLNGVRRKFGNIWQRIKINRRSRAQSLAISEIAEHIDRLQPDLLLIDMECHVAIVQTMNSGIVTILCSRWFSVFKSSGIPPMHTGLMPANTPKQSCLIAWDWYKLWLYKIRIDVIHRFSRRRFWPINYESNARYDLESLAKREKISLGEKTERFHWLIPHVYKQLPVMSLTLKELEFGDGGDERMHYVGPLIGAANTASVTYPSAVGDFHEFIKRHAKHPRPPLVYCSFSTFWQTDRANYEALCRLFSRRPDLDFVIGLGGNDKPDVLKSLPDNVLALEFAPQIEIMKYATAVVSHGGISTINEALYHGVPLIMCSSGHVDQDGCMARVAYHGVGLVAYSSPISDVELDELISRLTGDDTVANNIRRQVSAIQVKMHELDAENAMVSFVVGSIADKQRVS